MVKKVVLIGGAFDPVTIGHLSLAETVLKGIDVSEVWFLPSYQNVWEKKMASPLDRLKMLEISIVERYPYQNGIKLCGFEIENKLTGHTYDILKKLVTEYPPSEFDFYFLIGMDHADIIHTWESGDKLIKEFKFIVSERKGVKIDKSVDWYLRPPHLFIPGTMEISSTMARAEIVEKGETSLVTKMVMKHIRNKNLYNCKGAK